MLLMVLSLVAQVYSGCLRVTFCDPGDVLCEAKLPRVQSTSTTANVIGRAVVVSAFLSQYPGAAGQCELIHIDDYKKELVRA